MKTIDTTKKININEINENQKAELLGYAMRLINNYVQFTKYRVNFKIVVYDDVISIDCITNPNACIEFGISEGLNFIIQDNLNKGQPSKDKYYILLEKTEITLSEFKEFINLACNKLFVNNYIDEFDVFSKDYQIYGKNYLIDFNDNKNINIYCLFSYLESELKNKFKYSSYPLHFLKIKHKHFNDSYIDFYVEKNSDIFVSLAINNGLIVSIQNIRPLRGCLKEFKYFENKICTINEIIEKLEEVNYKLWIEGEIDNYIDDESKFNLNYF